MTVTQHPSCSTFICIPFRGCIKALLVQYMPYCTAKNVNLRPWAIYSPPRQYIAQAGNILPREVIYCPGGAIYCPGAKYWPNSLKLGQICPQCNSDCRATISTVGWLPYRKVNGFLMRILQRQQDSKTSGTLLMTNTFMNIIMTIRFSLARFCSNTINHTTIAGFWQLDFWVELMDNLLFCYSSHETWNANCSVAVLSRTCRE